MTAQQEIAEHLAVALNPQTFRKKYEGIESSNPEWNAIPVSGGDSYDWQDDSTYIQEPPFFADMAHSPAPIRPIRAARALAVVGDSTTTDHISPAGAIAEASLRDHGAVMVVPDLAAAFDLSNQVAPEHLELHVEEPFQYLSCIQNAGAIFLGPHTPEPVGDYIAGPNHVLPTAGTARFASALSVDHFIKKTSVVYYAEKALKRDASDIIRLAEIEGLSAHAEAIRARKKR